MTVKYSRDQRYIAFARHQFSDTPIVIVNADSGLTLYQIVPTTLKLIHEIDFSFDSSMIIACGHSGYKIYQISNLSILQQKDYPSRSFSCKFTPQNEYAVAVHSQVIIYKIDGSEKWKYSGGAFNHKLVWSPDFTALAVAGDTLGIVVYNLTSNLMSTLNYACGSVNYGLDWSSDGKYIIINAYSQ